MSDELPTTGAENLPMRELVDRIQQAFPEEHAEIAKRIDEMGQDLFNFMHLTREAYVTGFAHGKERHSFPITEETLEGGYRDFLVSKGLLEAPRTKKSDIVLPN